MSIFSYKTLSDYAPNSIKYIESLKTFDEVSGIENYSPIFSDEPPLTEVCQIDNDQFTEELYKLNQTVHDLARVKLNELGDQLADSNIAIALTGSDGRFEKVGFNSPLELIVIVGKIEDTKNPSIEKITEHIKKFPHIFDPEIEVKCLKQNSLICFNLDPGPHASKRDLPFPTRALDALYIAGSKELYEEYQKIFFQQVFDKQNAKLINRFRTHQIKSVRSNLSKITTESNKDCSKYGVDSKESTLKYDGERIKATKHTLLRIVQYTIAYQIFKNIQLGKISFDQYKQIPRNLTGRISWMQSNKFLDLSLSHVKEISDAYNTSLIWFACAQENFMFRQRKITNVNKEELSRVLAAASILKDFSKA